MKTARQLFTIIGILSSISCVHPGHRDPAALKALPTQQVKFVDDGADCQGKFDDVISQQQKEVISQTMAPHLMRLNHLLWHATRNGWGDLSASEKSAIQKLSSEWGRNAPLCPAPSARDSKYNAAGEEFLLMHHQMIDHLRQALREKGLNCIAGWSAIPGNKDRYWPIPPGDADDSSKSDEMGSLVQIWSKKFYDDKFLKSHSLSEIGFLLEFSIHNNLHMRWAEPPKPGDDFSPLDGTTEPQIILRVSEHDDPKYDWLGNPFTAHVNPVFWKLHGWVDSVLQRWLIANGKTKIGFECDASKVPACQCDTNDSSCYKWQSQWTGGRMSETPHLMGARWMRPNDVSVAERAARKAAPKAMFRNDKFDDFLKSRHHPQPGPPRAEPPVDLSNPDVFVQKFGPCPQGA